MLFVTTIATGVASFILVFTRHESWVTSPNDIRDAIARLDGESCSLITFITEDESANRCVAGGGDGLYLVVLTIGVDTASYTLLDDTLESEATNEIVLVTGGQEVIKPRAELVDQPTATVAVEYWAEYGEMDPSRTWRRDF